MRISDFDFHLPEELIARYPLPNRSDSRLLYLYENGKIKHAIFSELPQLLSPNDVLIFNNTRVIPARLFAKKATGGKVEILIERFITDNHAIAHVKSNKTLRLPCKLILENGEVVFVTSRDQDLFRLEFQTSFPLSELLKLIGHIPLPGYMRREAENIDHERYQTIYAHHEGAVAAPTAGLHFDEALFKTLQNQGIRFEFITLHVGAGTFKPVTVDDIVEHRMHYEYIEVSSKVCDLINQTKKIGGRVIAVGTTTVRALETVMKQYGELKPYKGETNIFIYPGYRFQCIDALITNFHLPKSTLLMLVCALGGYKNVMFAYQNAIYERYRFYSYGDAMFLHISKEKI